MSPSEANSFAKATSPASSSAWKRKFSSNKTSPGFRFLAAVCAGSPIESVANLTSTPKISEAVFKICFNEYFSYANIVCNRWSTECKCATRNQSYY